MLYNYEIKYSDNSVVKNSYSMGEREACAAVGKEIQEHFLYGNKDVSITSVKILGVK